MVRSWLPEKGGGRRYNVLQVCYSMSRARYSALQRVTGALRARCGRVTACYSALRAVTGVLQRVTGVLPRVTACFSVLRAFYSLLQRVTCVPGCPAP